jgi:hypothetical protein
MKSFFLVILYGACIALCVRHILTWSFLDTEILKFSVQNKQKLSSESGIPQTLLFGKFRNESAWPYISSDIWVELVDNKCTFFIRPTESGSPSMEELRDWVRSRPHPVTLLLNNQVDKSWPDDLDNLPMFERVLNETNTFAVYATNARKLEKHPKLRPLPIGPKWQWRETSLYGESKYRMLSLYEKNFSDSPELTERLFFSPSRTEASIFVRAMKNSNRRTQNYKKDNAALLTPRSQIPKILGISCPKALNACIGCLVNNVSTYVYGLKKHQFVISPAGNGLDSHGTWEALLAGCIPIVQHSDIDAVYEDLPVWLVNSWDEVTDEALLRNAKEFKMKKYNWKKNFAEGWRHFRKPPGCIIKSK